MSTELWLDDCERMCIYLQSDNHLYDFFMNYKFENDINQEFINNFQSLQKKNWIINDEKYLLLCLKLAINEIKRVISRI